MSGDVILRAVLELRPGASAAMPGHSIEDLVWLDHSIPRPSDEAILARAREIEARGLVARPELAEIVEALWAQVALGDSTLVERLRPRMEA